MVSRALRRTLFVDIEDTLRDKFSALACDDGAHFAQTPQDHGRYRLRLRRRFVEAFVVLRELN